MRIVCPDDEQKEPSSQWRPSTGPAEAGVRISRGADRAGLSGLSEPGGVPS